MSAPRYDRSDFANSPLLVFYEVTRACDLLCRHCRAKAQPRCHPEELKTDAAKALVDALATFPKPPLLVLTGGDPIKRADVFELVSHASAAGLKVAMTPSATPLVTSEAIARLKAADLHRLAISLDGADTATHDDFRRVPGSFSRTMEILADARAVGLSVQINTTIARHNVDQLDAMADLLATQGIEMWSVFFLVPTGRARAGERLDAMQCEAVFEKLWRQTQGQPYAIKTTEAPHYRRFVMQRMSATGGAMPGNLPLVGTNDGKGVMFVSHIGEIFPSGFLPLNCGRFPQASPVEAYQNHPLFRSLRDPDQLQGKCGLCDYRELCGGSRARAYAVNGDPLAAEPDCLYLAPAVREKLSVAVV